MPSVEIGKQELHYQRGGSGEPLLLVQGMSGTHVSWGEPFVELLRRDFDVTVFDNRGIGLSGAVDGPFTIVEMAEDTVGLLDALELDTAHVMGISMGGMIAQELALAHPERLRTLALGCTYCGGPGSRLMPEENFKKLAEGMASGDRGKAIRASYEVNLSPGFRAEEGNYAGFEAMATSVPVRRTTMELQIQAIFGHDTSGRLGEISAPTLIVHGTEDGVLPVENGKLIASLMPAARLELLEGVGHMFWWEQPERSAELLRQHVAARV